MGQVGHGSSSEVRWTGISRYLPIIPRIPLDWDSKIKAKTDDAILERDEDHLGRFLKQNTSKKFPIVSLLSCPCSDHQEWCLGRLE